jgi:Holliday junction resolvase
MTALQSPRGREAEVRLMEELETDGWLVGSRRHVTGPGDILAMRFGLFSMGGGSTCIGRLIEVRTCRQLPTDSMEPEELHSLSVAARRSGVSPWIAWSPPGSRAFSWLCERDWSRHV